MKPVFYTPYTLPENHNDLGAIECLDPSLTVQADAVDADINTIVKRFGLTGELPYGVRVPEYADYSDIPSDYQSALQFISDADASFMEFPATVRSRFDNDTAKFLDFVSNPSNVDEAIALGLATKPQAEPLGDNVVPQAEGAGVAQSST